MLSRPGSNSYNHALIALGSNLGEPRACLDFAVTQISQLDRTRLERVSSFHATEPVGGPSGQGAFLNAAAFVSTQLQPEALLLKLHRIEALAGRERKVHWGERTLDLDLILYGKERIATSQLTVPHPRMSHRSFVMDPAAEIAGHMIDPWTGRSIADLHSNLTRKPHYLAIVAPIGPGRDLLIARIAANLNAKLLVGMRSSADTLLYTAPPPAPAHEFHDQFQQAAEALDSNRWASLDTWVLSDFWIDQFYVSAQLQFASNTCKLLPFRDRFLQARPNLLAPTLVAFWDPPESTWETHISDFVPSPDLTEWHSRGVQLIKSSWAVARKRYYEYRETVPCRDPILIVQSGEVYVAADEILTACGSIRV